MATAVLVATPAAAVVVPMKDDMVVPKLNLDLLLLEEQPRRQGKKKQPPPKASDNREGKMSKSQAHANSSRESEQLRASLHNSFVPLSEEESSLLASPASSTELLATALLAGKPFKAAANANSALGSDLAVQQLLDEVDERKSRKSRRRSQLHKSRHRLPQHDEDVSTSIDDVEVKLSITPSAAPLFYSSDLLYASEPSEASLLTKPAKPSLYDTPFWRKYGFVIVHLSMVLCQSCFAAVNVFGKYGLIYVHPMVLIILRNVGTLPFLMAGVAVLERNQAWKCISWSNMLKFSAMGVVTMLFSQSLYVYGLQLSTATNSATLHLAIPVWTCMVCIACGMERFSIIKVLGIGFAVGGALVMVEVESFDFSGDMMTGNLLILGMTVLYSLYLVMCKPLVSNLPPLNVSMWIFITASVASIPLAVIYWREFWDAMHVANAQAWMSIALAVVVGTAIPYLIITWAIKQASPLVVAIYTPMELIATTTLAFLYLGEEPGLRQFAGALCILAGLCVTTYAQQTETKREPTEDIEEATADNRLSLDSDKSFTAGLDISETTPLIARTA